MNDSVFYFKYHLKNQVQFVHIYIGINSDEEKELLNLENDSIKLPIEEVEFFMQSKISLLEKKGYSLAKLKLSDYNQVEDYLQAKLVLDLNQKRTLNNIIIEGHDKFPYGIKKAILKKAMSVQTHQHGFYPVNVKIKF